MKEIANYLSNHPEISNNIYPAYESIPVSTELTLTITEDVDIVHTSYDDPQQDTEQEPQDETLELVVCGSYATLSITTEQELLSLISAFTKK